MTSPSPQLPAQQLPELPVEIWCQILSFTELSDRAHFRETSHFNCQLLTNLFFLTGNVNDSIKELPREFYLLSLIQRELQLIDVRQYDERLERFVRVYNRILNKFGEDSIPLNKMVSFRGRVERQYSHYFTMRNRFSFLCSLAAYGFFSYLIVRFLYALQGGLEWSDSNRLLELDDRESYGILKWSDCIIPLESGDREIYASECRRFIQRHLAIDIANSRKLEAGAFTVSLLGNSLLHFLFEPDKVFSQPNNLFLETEQGHIQISRNRRGEKRDALKESIFYAVLLVCMLFLLYRFYVQFTTGIDECITVASEVPSWVSLHVKNKLLRYAAPQEYYPWVNNNCIKDCQNEIQHVVTYMVVFFGTMAVTNTCYKPSWRRTFFLPAAFNGLFRGGSSLISVSSTWWRGHGGSGKAERETADRISEYLADGDDPGPMLGDPMVPTT